LILANGAGRQQKLIHQRKAVVNQCNAKGLPRLVHGARI
jgi:hypothetical protein